jgi:hypothetical protein
MNDQTSRTPYVLGALHQHCSECEWSQSGHRVEVTECPLCGAAIDKHVALVFGGVTVEFDGTRFTFTDWKKDSVEVDEADYPDTIEFMRRHAHQIYGGPSPYQPRICSGERSD